MGNYENNHLYPKFHIKRWYLSNAMLLDKDTMGKRTINLKLDFTRKRYYWINGDPDLEIRFGKFECYIAQLVDVIDNANDYIELTSKQLYLLKLYCRFAAERQESTSEVIISDDMGLYRSNNYRVGVFHRFNRIQVIEATKTIIEEFERINTDENFIYEEKYDLDSYSNLCDGLHLVILKTDTDTLIAGNVCGLIENTSDGDHLYFYLPVTPRTALILVNSEYYLDSEHLELAKKYLPRLFHLKNNSPLEYIMRQPGVFTYNGRCELAKTKYFGVIDDPYLSYILDHDENILLRSYYKELVHYRKIRIKVKIIPMNYLTCLKFNSIIYMDSKLLLYCGEKVLADTKELKPQFRDITIGIGV